MAFFTRRRFLQTGLLAGSGTIVSQSISNGAAARSLPKTIALDRNRPKITDGVMSGDISGNQAVIWSRSDRLSRMRVEFSLDESFRRSQRVRGEVATDAQDFTARTVLRGLPSDRPIFYRVQFEDLERSSNLSEPVVGRLQIPGSQRSIKLAWSGDTAGQGWGINPEWGGFRIYETIRQMKPDCFIHCGDTIYADNPIVSEVKLDDGSIWKNLTTPEKSKVAETLEEFRGNYRYNLMDEHIRRFNAEVPQLWQWDDHEVTNNWYPTELLNDDRYQVKEVSLLASRGKQAFLEYAPVHPEAKNAGRVYRSFQFGALLDVFMLDMRSYRAANSPNRQSEQSAVTAFLGSDQIQWLKQQLQRSRATWKIIASDMPLGLIVRDGKTDFENLSNGDGPPLGRELELADLLRSIKQKKIQNVVWLTADVHYAAAHYYDPNLAQFQDFNGFWEFVAGPLHSGTFGPNDLDNTFGPQVKFQSVQPGLKLNSPPSAGLQFFGIVEIDPTSKAMAIALHNLEGKRLFTQTLPAMG